MTLEIGISDFQEWLEEQIASAHENLTESGKFGFELPGTQYDSGYYDALRDVQQQFESVRTNPLSIRHNGSAGQ